MVSYRTPRWKIVFKVATITWVLTLFFGFPCLLLLGSIDGNYLLAFVEFTAIVYGTIFVAMYGMSIILNVISLIVDRDPRDKELRRRGYDVYFDNLPQGFLGINNDSRTVRMGGLPEPQSNFEPPSDWTWQCPACGARNPPEEGAVCWHCGGELTQHGDWLWRCNACQVRVPGLYGNCWKCGNSLSNDP